MRAAARHHCARTHCEHSAVFPLLWKSIMHWMSWLFSSSNCTHLHHVLKQGGFQATEGEGR